MTQPESGRYAYFDTYDGEVQQKLISLDFVLRAIESGSSNITWTFPALLEAAGQVENYLFDTDQTTETSERKTPWDPK